MLDQRFLNARLTQVGKIRTGLPPEPGKKHPRKLPTLRFTSQAKWLIEEIAKKYGGEVRIWADAPKGRQWEVVTTVDTLPIYLPRQRIDAWFELWKDKATCERRCTGRIEVNRGRACLCDPNGTMERDDPRRACKVVTRMTVMLADVPSLGGWGVQSSGWNAVDEWAKYAPMLSNLEPDALWPAHLLLDRRSSNVVDDEGRKAREYAVPIVIFDEVTGRQLAGGAQNLSRILAGGENPERPAIESGEPAADQKALEATASAGQPDNGLEAALAEIGSASSVDELEQIKTRLVGSVLDYHDSPAVRAWFARRRELNGGAAAGSEREGPVDAEPVDAEPVDAEPPAPTVVHRAPEAVYADIIREAAPSGWTTSRVNAAICQALGVESPGEAHPEDLESFLEDLRNGRFHG